MVSTLNEAIKLKVPSHEVIVISSIMFGRHTYFKKMTESKGEVDVVSYGMYGCYDNRTATDLYNIPLLKHNEEEAMYDNDYLIIVYIGKWS